MRIMWLSGNSGHGLPVEQHYKVCTVTSRYPSWFDHRCCQDVKTPTNKQQHLRLYPDRCSLVSNWYPLLVAPGHIILTRCQITNTFFILIVPCHRLGSGKCKPGFYISVCTCECECALGMRRLFAVCIENSTLGSHSYWITTGSDWCKCEPSVALPIQTVKCRCIPCKHSHSDTACMESYL